MLQKTIRILVSKITSALISVVCSHPGCLVALHCRNPTAEEYKLGDRKRENREEDEVSLYAGDSKHKGKGSFRMGSHDHVFKLIKCHYKNYKLAF